MVHSAADPVARGSPVSILQLPVELAGGKALQSGRKENSSKKMIEMILIL